MFVRARPLALAAALFGGAFQLEAADVSPGTVLEVRLAQLVSSYGATVGQPVGAVLVSPIGDADEIWLPAGTEVLGRVTFVKRIGLGIRREVAGLELTFDRLRLPSGDELPIGTRLLDVDNAREDVNNARITGIRATASLGRRISGLIVGFVALRDVLLMGFAFSGSLAVMRFPESEIILPAGTELKLGLTRTLHVERTFPAPVPSLATSAEEQAEIEAFAARCPFRTHTRASDVPSDLTNVLMIGPATSVSRAFQAAGWSPSDELTASSSYRAFVAMAENGGYAAAPMSELVLDHMPPAFTFQKGLNTFSKRHHLRVFSLSSLWHGEPAWTASATQDIGIAFSREKRTFIHVIDRHIDHERSKVINDLMFTGCIDAAELVDRPNVPRDARNATGEPLLTDRRIAVMHLNECTQPRVVRPRPGMAALGNPVQRGFRHFFLAVKHDLWRGNVVYQIYEGMRFAGRHLFARDHNERPGDVMVVDGVEYRLSGTAVWAPGGLSIRRSEDPHGPSSDPQDRGAEKSTSKEKTPADR